MTQIIMYIIQINNYYTTRSQMAAIAPKAPKGAYVQQGPSRGIRKMSAKSKLKYEERLFYERIK